MSEQEYLDAIVKFEKKCEESIIDTFARLDIHATVKADRYSLPYQKEVVVKLGGESYLNGPYEFFRVAKKVVKDVLNEDCSKIRFYFYINVVPSKLFFDDVEYKFRYYIHK